MTRAPEATTPGPVRPRSTAPRRATSVAAAVEGDAPAEGDAAFPDARYHPTGALAVAAAVASVAAVGLVQPRGPGNSGLADLFIALAIGTVVVWAGAARVSVRVPFGVPTALLVLGGALGGLAGRHQVIALLTLAQDVTLFVWCVALANVARTADRLALVIRAWIAAATVYAGLVVVASASKATAVAGVTLSQDGGRVTLTFGDPNMAGSYLALSVLLVLAVRHPRSAGRRRVVLALLGAGLYATGSNGAFIALAIGLGVYGIDALVRRRGPLVALATAGLVAFVAVAVLGSAATGSLTVDDVASGDTLSLSVGRSNESLLWRQRAKQYALALYYEGGLLGAGPASSVERLRDRPDTEAIELHDDYLAALVERGAVGAVGMLLLVLTLAAQAWSVTHEPLRAAYSRVVVRPAALLGALAGVLTSGVVYEILHFRHLWAFFAVLAALWLWGRE